MNKKVQQIKWLYLSAFLLPMLAMAQEKEKERNIDEVVLVGYSKVSKKDVTNAVSSVKAEALKDMPVNSAAEAIQGRLAGVQVQASEGSPGAEVDIKVRGGTSITGSNAPLYIVDGVQMDNAMSLLTPKEIESIEVLKDASSTSIYGSRGANGVVLITTKSGKKRATTSINYNGFTGVRKIMNTLDVLDPYEFVMYQYELYNKNGVAADVLAFTTRYGTYNELYNKYSNVKRRDWQDELFGREAFNFTHNLTVNGGSEKSAFALTLNHVDEDGIMLNSGFKRSMVNFKYDYDISKKLKFGFNARYSRSLIDGVGTSSTGSQSNNRLRNAVRYQPFEGGSNIPVDDFDPDYATNTNLVNPLILNQNEVRTNRSNDLLLNGYINWNISKDFTFRSVIGYVQRDIITNQFWGTVTSQARANADMPIVQLDRSQSRRITNTNTLNYTKKFGRHKLDVLLGQEIIQTDGETSNTYVKWFPKSILPQEAFSNIAAATPPAGLIQDAARTAAMAPDRLASFFGRVNYIFDNKYILTASVRADGSNVFMKGNQWGYFPAASLAWKVNEEKFLKDVSWLEELKLRVGYGLSGNNRITSYLWANFYNIGANNGYVFGTSVTPGAGISTTQANPNVKWEATVSKNAGIDFGFFNGRLYGSVDGYITDTKDLLVLAKVPFPGYANQFQNSGKTQNKGLEFTLGGAIVNKEDFTWKTDINLSANKNKILSLGSGVRPGQDYYLVQSGGIGGFDFIAKVGSAVGTYYGYVTEGRYEVSDFDYNAATQVYTLKAGVPSTSAIALGARAVQPGDLKLKDLNGDGQITDADRQELGSAQPKFFGGFNQTFRYKNFDMSLFFNFSVGNKVYNANKIENTTQYLYRDNNMAAEVADRWRWFDNNGVKVNDPTALAALNANTTMWTPPSGQYILHSYGIEDGSFLRLNNVTLGFTLPKGSLEAVGVKNFRLYATVNNVFVLTKYSGYDPEASTRRNPLTPGVDYSAYPRSRFFVTGVDITF
ncbi:SusC/RagA family TonB-linked outer membrane protein [Chryseobacterium sp. Leaf404]|uniref:SusC/RagA family TonB-linked outer membrane protein n=1 Tax=unclassified Chryseobacterium TaxID=2593645 RepID=UPI0006FFA200|nr:MULTISPECIES: TonB-dependent receptor [unclassified Chryseobacterium]KQT16136.1 SusC/RagA family TonB-linked outer membrane protein [Chryseobacterium sp. Leaf404]